MVHPEEPKLLQNVRLSSETKHETLQKSVVEPSEQRNKNVVPRLPFPFTWKLQSGGHFLRPAAGSRHPQRAALPGTLGEGFKNWGLQLGARTAMGRDGLCPAACTILSLSPPRYQAVQEAQKELGAAVAEALPEAERVLAAVQQVVTDTALRPASLPVPVALVSSAILGVLQGLGEGENGAAGGPAWPRQGQRTWLTFNYIMVD